MTSSGDAGKFDLDGVCMFAHTGQEKIYEHIRTKVIMCESIAAKDKCSSGDRCYFAHSEKKQPVVKLIYITWVYVA